MALSAELCDDDTEGMDLMTFWIRHKFHTAKTDGPDSTLVKPTNWNADHDMNMDEGTIIGRPPGSGEGPAQPISITSLMPAGMVMPYAGGTPPTGWLNCDGALYDKTTYAALFTAIGTAFTVVGTDPASQFRVPDLRGRVVACVDAGRGLLPSWVVGTAGGASSHTLSMAEMPYHNHGDTGHAHGVNDPGHVHNIDSYNYGSGVTGADSALQSSWAISGSWGSATSSVGTGVWIGTGYASLDYRGSNYAHNNVQPTMTLNYLIKA